MRHTLLPLLNATARHGVPAVTILPNAISRILMRDLVDETRLGAPAADDAARLRRRASFYNMTGGRGFRQDPAGPKLSRGGKTRKEIEAAGVAFYNRNLAAEAVFRAKHSGQPGWGIAAIRDAIERMEHLA
jgi:hypothetical protein